VRVWLRELCGLVVCVASPYDTCCFVRLTCISAPKNLGKPRLIGDCQKALDETNQTITFN
jgi:hypothetical protein